MATTTMTRSRVKTKTKASTVPVMESYAVPPPVAPKIAPAPMMASVPATAVKPSEFALPYPERPIVSHVKGPFDSDVVKYDNRDFSWSNTDEPHATRRKLILAAHPEIASLFVREPLTFWIVAACVAVQIAMAYSVRNAEWWIVLATAYVIGGTINHALQLASHELSHNLCFEQPWANKWTAILSNIPTGMPSAISFQRYHMDHHQYQGVDGIDTDIPVFAEMNYFSNLICKVIWLALQPFMYAFRPLLIKPKPMTKWEVFNWIACGSFDFALYYFLGTKALAYLIAGTLLGLGLHPSAGHFVAEHYEFVAGQETYSYYGCMNYVMFNVGYHNEHHDFPRVPWSKLPAVKAMAPEFYDTLPCYNSYLYVFWRFITDAELGPFARIKRKAPQAVYDRMDAKGEDKQNGTKAFVVACFSAMDGMISFLSYKALF